MANTSLNDCLIYFSEEYLCHLANSVNLGSWPLRKCSALSSWGFVRSFFPLPFGHIRAWKHYFCLFHRYFCYTIGASLSICLEDGSMVKHFHICSPLINFYMTLNFDRSISQTLYFMILKSLDRSCYFDYFGSTHS